VHTLHKKNKRYRKRTPIMLISARLLVAVYREAKSGRTPQKAG
jgi:hypothetical protein